MNRVKLMFLAISLGVGVGLGYSTTALAATSCETCYLQYNHCMSTGRESPAKCQAKLNRCERGCFWY